MGCGRPLADLPTLSIVPFSVNFVLDGAHGLPFGGYRTAPTADDTDRGYTGHHHTDGFGLIDMKARFNKCSRIIAYSIKQSISF